MQFRNTSGFDDRLVRNMLRWMMRELDMPRSKATGKRALRSIQFRKRSRACWSGRAWSGGRVIVSIGPDSCFPTVDNSYKRASKPQDGSDYLTIADRMEALVMVTAHELGHIVHFRLGHFGRGSEDIADAMARKVLRDFRERRAELVAAWSAAPETAPVIESTETPAAPSEAARSALQERRAAKAAAMLAKWQKRLKIAKGRVSKYRRTVGYYERVAAAK